MSPTAYRLFGALVLGLGLLFGLLIALPIAAEDTPVTGAVENQAEALPTPDRAYRKTNSEVVLITDQSVDPQLVRLQEGQLVAWINYSKAASQIVFERDIARNMICHSLVKFSLVEDELRSDIIEHGEFASFCELKPGRYKYKVLRGRSPTPGVDAASRRLEGEIVVGNPG